MDERPNVFDAVIVGAGIAGLTAAWTLRDRKILVIESSDRVGGRMMSLSRGPYWLNLGAHVLGGPETVFGGLADSVGVETRAIPGNRMGLALRDRILASGRPDGYPFRLPLSLRGRASLARAGIRLRLATASFLRATREEAAGRPEPMARFLARHGARSVADYLGRLHPDVHAIFSAITERLAAPPEDLAAAAGATMFGMVWGGSDRLARNVIGGSQRLPEAIAARLGNRIVLGGTVVGVEQDGDSVRVVYRTGQSETRLHARHAVVATPAYVTHGIVRGLSQDTADALAWLPYGPFYCAAILTEETGPMPWDDVYAIAVADRTFGMFFNHANVLRGPGPREPGGSLMVYAGGERARPLFRLSDGEIRERFLADLYGLYPELREIVREVVIQRWQKGVPYARPGRYALQPAIERQQGRVHLAGDYFSPVASVESAAASGLRAALRIEAALKVPAASSA